MYPFTVSELAAAQARDAAGSRLAIGAGTVLTLKSLEAVLNVVAGPASQGQ